MLGGRTAEGWLRPLALAASCSALWFALETTPAQIRKDPTWSPRLLLSIIDAESGKPTAARVSLEIDGQAHDPTWLGSHGLRFVSVHISKRQSQVVVYARGSGPLEIPLTPEAKTARIHVVKGFDYVPVSVDVNVEGDPIPVEVRLRRWNRFHAQGWRAADAHLHYDRSEPNADRDWFDMLDADGLTHGQFMVLKGGMVPGIWAKQFAYGSRGVGTDGRRTIIPGEEYRDSLQGHTLLFGLDEIIQPIMAGRPDAPYNFPPLYDVLRRTRELGGMPGVAHGGAYGDGVTAALDAVLGAVDFWEIGNSHLYNLDTWYRLLNCGFILPPTAGTDLPNNPYRDPWQPFLGAMRMYTRTGDVTGPDAWNRAVRNGEVFVSSGPLVRLTINGEDPAGALNLSATEMVSIRAELSATRPLRELEIIQGGKVIATASNASHDGDTYNIVLERSIEISGSTWLAARGVGVAIDSVKQDAIAHTAAMPVFVASEPIWSAADAEFLIRQFEAAKQLYAQKGRYNTPADRARVQQLHDRGIEQLSR